MERKPLILSLAVFVILSVMAITMYLDYMDMFVWSAIHHHTAKSQLKSGFLTFCLLMWNMSQFAWLPVFVKLFAKDEKLCKQAT